MSIKEKFIYHLLQPIHKGSIMALGIYTLIWGLWVANPFWNVFNQAQLFSTMGVFAPEVFWGLFATVCGILTIIGASKNSVRSLIAGANVAWVHWTMIALFYFIGDWHNTGGITSLFIAGYAAYLWLNIKVNHKIRGVDTDHLFR